MHRVRRLFMLLLTFACCQALELEAEPSAFRVDWMIFSGRPNPSFVINDSVVIRQIVSTFTALPLHPTLTEKDSAAPSLLGYSGFHMTPTGMDGVAWIDVYGSAVEVASSATVAGTQARTFRFDKDSVLEQLLFQAVRAQGVVPATPEPPTLPSTVVGVPIVERSVTISLGAPIFSVVATPIRPPVTVRAGTRVRLVATQAAENATDVMWVRNSREIPGTNGRTLEIASASPADSGLYWAVVGMDASQSTSAQAELLVTTFEGQRLLNLSVLSRIGTEQRVLILGFTIEPGAVNSRTLVLVRAVGPALGPFGVDGPLRTPQLRVVDASGATVAPANIPFALPTVTAATERVGAFALPANSTDIALLYYLPAGAFTAHVSSADAGAGNVLLETYEVPLN